MRLVVLRHADAEEGHGGDDLDRPLSGHGRRDASRMGRWLRDGGWTPDRVLCSPARRAQQTARLAQKAAGSGSDALHTDERLYLASLDTLLDIVEGLGDEAGTFWIVGHDPGLSDLVQRLSPEPVMGRDGMVLPTATAACFEDGRLLSLQRPRGL